jgi:hypothetical protein
MRSLLVRYVIELDTISAVRLCGLAGHVGLSENFVRAEAA